MKYLTIVNGKPFEVEINQNGRVSVNGNERAVDFLPLQAPLYSLLIDHQSYEALIEIREGQFNVAMLSNLFEVTVADERTQRLEAARGAGQVEQGEVILRSPMPGLIVAVPVSEGQAVQKGDPIIVLESMKMENELKAPRAGTIHKIHVNKGERVEQNKPLITLG
jgi:biotin carboxyl carrier protein